MYCSIAPATCQQWTKERERKWGSTPIHACAVGARRNHPGDSGDSGTAVSVLWFVIEFHWSAMTSQVHYLSQCVNLVAVLSVWVSFFSPQPPCSLQLCMHHQVFSSPPAEATFTTYFLATIQEFTTLKCITKVCQYSVNLPMFTSSLVICDRSMSL